MLLSIIIPVYKVERYIKATLQSVFNQNIDTTSYEVIVINDGTPDDSMSIVTEFSKKYENLFIISQANQGLSCARNAGLKRAKGDYVWFVDSDDTIVDNAIAMFSSLTKMQADIYVFGLKKTDEKNGMITEEFATKEMALFLTVAEGKKVMNKVKKCPIQRCIFRRDFLLKNKLFFYPKIYHEDLEFAPKAFFLAERIYVVNKAIYNYLLRISGSITSTIKIKSCRDMIIVMHNLEKFRKYNACTKYDNAIFKQYIFMYLLIFFEYAQRCPDKKKVKKIVSEHCSWFRQISSYGISIYFPSFKNFVFSLLCFVSPKLLYYKYLI